MTLLDLISNRQKEVSLKLEKVKAKREADMWDTNFYDEARYSAQMDILNEMELYCVKQKMAEEKDDKGGIMDG